MSSRLAATVLAAALALGLLWKSGGSRAADTDSTTWGAMDPTWSPDGRRIGFTLYGSIWAVGATGGDAERITHGPGYHAHPAWSPDGASIAYISGPPPAGVLPNVSGRLMVVDLASRAERQIETPVPTAGTPTWSPDSRRIACALGFVPGGALMHEVEVATGRVRALQQRPQRGSVGNWAWASWNPKREELFYGGQRQGAVQNGSQLLGAPQVWSMHTGADPITVLLPLTNYRLGDIAQLHSVSALPDGSGAIYSAVVVNGKGDRELYRIPRDGGKPVAITNTPRDEFSPAVSPDGKLVAHVSNHLGNVDIFTMPLAGGAKTHVAIQGLNFGRPTARLRIATHDESGNPSPVRLYLRAADGKTYGPKGVPVFYYGLDPNAPREGFFLTTGDDTVTLPAGPVRLVALKGVEYRIEERSLDLAADQTTDITIAMRRWTNWNQRGWYTGENHFHANYNGLYYQRPPQSLQWLESEDLNAANMIVANSEGGFVHDKEFFTGGVSASSKPRFLLYWGQEYRNSDPLGHMAFLNIKSQVPPSFTSVVGSSSPHDYPLNTQAAQEARKQGGVVVYVHPISAQLQDPLDTNLGAKEAPLTAALGAMDGIDVMPYGPAAFDMWYRLLNSGFRISPGAGTDVFTNWRGINRIPGASRQYVDTGTAFTWAKWVERFREGRVFVTNGPLLTFSANGQGPGSVVATVAGQPHRVKLVAEVQSQSPVDTVEFIQNGRVVGTHKIAAGGRVEMEASIDSSAWFAARVAGPPTRGMPTEPVRAHSGAAFVHVGGKPVLVRADLELMVRWLGALWANLEERNNYGSAANRARARALFDQALAHYRAKLAL
jgi:Tol biopolymer transport system component